MSEIKQVIVVRKDLNMRKGKMCAQASHASLKVILDSLELPHLIDGSERCEICVYRLNCTVPSSQHLFGIGCKSFTGEIRHIFTPEIMAWIQGSFKKIVLGCDSEQELLDLYKKAQVSGLPCAIILDNGETEFKEACPNCGGYTDPSKDSTCNTCKGTGKVNKPTYTTIAIGPDCSDKINQVTGHLKPL